MAGQYSAKGFPASFTPANGKGEAVANDALDLFLAGTEKVLIVQRLDQV